MHTVTSIKKAKGTTPLCVITAYDSLFAALFNNKVDMILVGDSLNMSFAGKSDTLSASLDAMIYHTKAVCLGAPETFVICDMPFGTYTDASMALANATRVYQETSAHAIKIEGGSERAHIIKALTQNSIAVVGHIGLMPQFVRSEGGYKIRGKDETDAQKLLSDAKAVEAAGAFLLVLEGICADVAKRISEAISIPTIGIGSGVDTDGQVLVWSDMLGFYEQMQPKFVKRYLNGADLIRQSVDTYIHEVKNRSFPTQEHSY